MALLTKCIYGFETNSKKTPFGLLNDQYRIDNIIQSAGWFNLNGERLGSGDLALKDMQHIAKSIPPGEAFFALTEMDSSWDLPSHLDRTEPGFAYVMQKASWVMVKTNLGGVVIRVRNDISKPEDAAKDGIKYVRFPRKDLYTAFSFDPSKGRIAPPAPAPKKKLDDDSSKAAPSSKSAFYKPTASVPAQATKTVPKKGVGYKSYSKTKPVAP